MPEMGFLESFFSVIEMSMYLRTFPRVLASSCAVHNPGKPCVWTVLYNGCPTAVQCPAPLVRMKLLTLHPFVPDICLSITGHGGHHSSDFYVICPVHISEILSGDSLSSSPQVVNRWKILWGRTCQAPCWEVKLRLQLMIDKEFFLY